MILGKTIEYRSTWRKWFAWRPVTEHRNYRLVWLEWVWTKEICGNFWPYHVYKLLNDTEYEVYGREGSPEPAIVARTPAMMDAEWGP